MLKQLVELGGEPTIGTPETFEALIAVETQKRKNVIEGNENKNVG